jgi:ketosteroid isomerase-like protein
MMGSRKDAVLKALEAEMGETAEDLTKLCTDDVVGWSPLVSLSGLPALAELSAIRELAFSNVVVLTRGLDEVGNKVFAEWVVEADHTGPYVLSDDAVIAPTGRRVKLAGVTVAEFRGEKIRAFRTYFDDLSLIEQLVDA